MKIKSYLLGIAAATAVTVSGPLVEAASFTTGASGGVQPVNNVQPGLGINHIVALTGVFPSGEGDTVDDTVLGEVKMFGGNFAPGGWAFANGQLLPIANNQALFSLYGTTYGGDGESTFALPDLRGRTVVGTGNASGPLATRAPGAKFGANDVTLGQNQLPSHEHGLSTTGSTTSTGVDPTTGVDNHQASAALTYTINTVGVYDSAGNGGIARVRMNGGNFAFNGMALEGQLLNPASNSALFSLLGTTYGGDGETTFRLPDLAGRNAIGMGAGPGLTSRSLGALVGDHEIILIDQNLASHSHGIVDVLDTSGTSILNAGGGQSTDNMQPGQVMNYMVNMFGTFPSEGGVSGDFIGEIALWGGNYTPRGWAMAAGQLLPIAQNDALYSIFGTTYGGDGEVTFALPDLRGRTPIHVGAGPGLAPVVLGQKMGIEDFTMNVASMPSHTHDYEATIVPVPSAGLVGAVGFGLLGMMRRRKRAA